jgi:ElaB/YqjD/DUF883 family membrane-anchored ribosome-binding protein
MGHAETLDRTNGRVTDRAMDIVGRAAHLAHDVKAMKAVATDAAEDGARVARRAVKQTVHRAQDLVDETTHQVKRRPLQAIGLAFAAGSMVGLIVGWLGHRRTAR